MSLTDTIRFQKTLALFASASNQYEAEAAELAARRLIETRAVDPLRIPDYSLYSRVTFADNALLKRLREEALAAALVVESAEPEPDMVVAKCTPTVSPFGRIAFSVEGYRRALRKGKPRARAKLSFETYDAIRRLYNQGMRAGEVGEALGLNRSTVNSSSQWQIRSGRWYRDADGLWQWAERLGAGDGSCST